MAIPEIIAHPSGSANTVFISSKPVTPRGTSAVHLATCSPGPRVSLLMSLLMPFLPPGPSFNWLKPSKSTLICLPGRMCMTNGATRCSIVFSSKWPLDNPTLLAMSPTRSTTFADGCLSKAAATNSACHPPPGPRNATLSMSQTTSSSRIRAGSGFLGPRYESKWLTLLCRRDTLLWSIELLARDDSVSLNPAWLRVRSSSPLGATEVRRDRVRRGFDMAMNYGRRKWRRIASGSVSTLMQQSRLETD